ncbi:MAG TPA: HEPN domain-containing protein [Geminicoccaceae bacterium]|nr:HEPN domain-containing protein [Geminicoccaceae bacterium]
MTQPKQRREASLWLAKAVEDIAAARRLMMSPDPLLGVAAYHVQQAAEKLLKSALTLRAIPFRKTHDLDELGDQVVAALPALAPLIEAVRPRTAWAFAFRYPEGAADAEPVPAASEIEAALAEIEALRAAITELSKARP